MASTPNILKLPSSKDGYYTHKVMPRTGPPCELILRLVMNGTDPDGLCNKKSIYLGGIRPGRIEVRVLYSLQYSDV
jgi:hypothetical protein